MGLLSGAVDSSASVPSMSCSTVVCTCLGALIVFADDAAHLRAIVLFVLSSVPSNSSVRVVCACLALFGAPTDNAACFPLLSVEQMYLKVMLIHFTE